MLVVCKHLAVILSSYPLFPFCSSSMKSDLKQSHISAERTSSIPATTTASEPPAETRAPHYAKTVGISGPNVIYPPPLRRGTLLVNIGHHCSSWQLQRNRPNLNGRRLMNTLLRARTIFRFSVLHQHGWDLRREMLELLDETMLCTKLPLVSTKKRK